MKKHCYYVSYTFKNNWGYGYGSYDVTTDIQINTPDTMHELVENIKEKNNFKFVVINSLIYLGKKKGD